MNGLRKKSKTAAKNKHAKSELQSKVKVRVKADVRQNEPRNYEVKEKKDVVINLDSSFEAILEAHGKTNSKCSQLPGLTDEDIEEIIKDSELDAFLEEIIPDETFTCDLPTSDVIGKAENNIHEDYDKPLDLSSNKVKILNSSLLPSNSSIKATNSSLMLNDVKKYDCDIPLAPASRRAPIIPKNRLPYAKCSSTTGSKMIPYSAIKNKDIKSAGQKNKHQDLSKHFLMPILVLDEILGLQGIKPIYELLPISKNNHFNPLFQYRVKFSNQYAHGSGKSMEDAKNAAARALLDLLTSSKFFGNLIGRLQELCMARHWPLPIYEQLAGINTKEGHGFLASCSVLRYKEFGQGSNKKAAKLLAAYKIWMKIVNKI